MTFALPLASATHVANAYSSGHQTILHLTRLGTAKLSGPGSATNDTSNLSDQVQPPLAADQTIPGHGNPNNRVPAAHVPAAPGIAVTSTNPNFFGFNGLSHYNQRHAGTADYTNTQFSLEPPDQMLCTDGSTVLEGVNNALAAYSKAGAPLSGPTAFSQFWNLKPEIIRSTPVVYGDFVSDPRCYYDSTTQRWFISELQFAQDPATGAFEGPSHILIAVSATTSPTGSFYTYKFTTTNDGSDASLPNDPGCPCFGDQPLMGADANGIYITTNEFPINGPGFNGAQVYAMSKLGLESGTLPPVINIAAPTLAEGQAYTIQPATTPPGGTFASNNGGTEYFLSALDFNASTDNRIAVWALTNTSTLNTNTPALALSSSLIQSELYGQPPNVQQKPGPTPLGTSLAGKTATASGPQQSLELLSSNDDRMNQVVYANGNLYGAVNTAIQPSNGPTRAGVAYFVVSPSVVNGQAAGTMVNQGYVAVDQASVIFPAIGVNANGNGFMTFTLSGPDYYPSAAYIAIGASGVSGSIHVAGPGASPEDGFTGYTPYGGNGVARWGDYSAAVAGSDGNIYMATEYIPNAQRTALANWGTFVSIVQP